MTDLISQGIVFLFLLDAEASLLVLGPTGFGLLVQLWKVPIVACTCNMRVYREFLSI